VTLQLFEGFGVELEYMLVDTERLNVLPIVDRLIEEVAGTLVPEFERGDLCWSNELVNHVIELKTNGPAPTLRGLDATFARDVMALHKALRPMDARLMPTAAHPWMDPLKETKLWPHELGAVYAAFDRIFGTRGHGWANLQSTHLNLPFRGDAEFGRLHAAIRILLPIIPALAASSPILDGRLMGLMDGRMHFYRQNQKKIPSITGKVIPEPVYTPAEYHEKILGPMYAAIAPHDPEEILQDEWLNARGAIARFDYGSIEIRIIDIQECPTADLAIVHALVCVLRALVSERWQPLARQMRADTDALNAILLSTTKDAERAVIHDDGYLEAFGLRAKTVTAGELWHHLVETVVAPSPDLSNAWASATKTLLEEGPLARRIVRAVAGDNPGLQAKLHLDEATLHGVYAKLCDCLRDNRMFHASA